MGIELRYPNIRDPEMKSYLYQLINDLQFAIDGISDLLNDTNSMAKESAKRTAVLEEATTYFGKIKEFIRRNNDTVVAMGTHDTSNGTWHYKKWISGTYEMFGSFTVPFTGSGDPIRYASQIDIDPPFALDSAYVAGTASGHSWITNGGMLNGNVSIDIASTDISALTVSVNLIVMGRYK